MTARGGGLKVFFFQKISCCCSKIMRVLAAQGKLVLQQVNLTSIYRVTPE